MNYGEPIEAGAPVYLAAVMEYLATVSQHSVTGTIADPNLCRHMASLSHNEFHIDA